MPRNFGAARVWGLHLTMDRASVLLPLPASLEGVLRTGMSSQGGNNADEILRQRVCYSPCVSQPLARDKVARRSRASAKWQRAV